MESSVSELRNFLSVPIIKTLESAGKLGVYVIGTPLETKSSLNVLKSEGIRFEEVLCFRNQCEKQSLLIVGISSWQRTLTNLIKYRQGNPTKEGNVIVLSHVGFGELAKTGDSIPWNNSRILTTSFQRKTFQILSNEPKTEELERIKRRIGVLNGMLVSNDLTQQSPVDYVIIVGRSSAEPNSKTTTERILSLVDGRRGEVQGQVPVVLGQRMIAQLSQPTFQFMKCVSSSDPISWLNLEAGKLEGLQFVLPYAQSYSEFPSLISSAGGEMLIRPENGCVVLMDGTGITGGSASSDLLLDVVDTARSIDAIFINIKWLFEILGILPPCQPDNESETASAAAISNPCKSWKDYHFPDVLPIPELSSLKSLAGLRVYLDFELGPGNDDQVTDKITQLGGVIVQRKNMADIILRDEITSTKLNKLEFFLLENPLQLKCTRDCIDAMTRVEEMHDCDFSHRPVTLFTPEDWRPPFRGKIFKLAIMDTRKRHTLEKYIGSLGGTIESFRESKKVVGRIIVYDGNEECKSTIKRVLASGRPTSVVNIKYILEQLDHANLLETAKYAFHFNENSEDGNGLVESNPVTTLVSSNESDLLLQRNSKKRPADGSPQKIGTGRSDKRIKVGQLLQTVDKVVVSKVQSGVGGVGGEDEVEMIQDSPSNAPNFIDAVASSSNNSKAAEKEERSAGEDLPTSSSPTAGLVAKMLSMDPFWMTFRQNLANVICNQLFRAGIMCGVLELDISKTESSQPAQFLVTSVRLASKPPVNLAPGSGIMSQCICQPLSPGNALLVGGVYRTRPTEEGTAKAQEILAIVYKFLRERLGLTRTKLMGFDGKRGSIISEGCENKQIFVVKRCRVEESDKKLNPESRSSFLHFSINHNIFGLLHESAVNLSFLAPFQMLVVCGSEDEACICGTKKLDTLERFFPTALTILTAHTESELDKTILTTAPLVVRLTDSHYAKCSCETRPRNNQCVVSLQPREFSKKITENDLEILRYMKS